MSILNSGRLVCACVADLFEGAFDELFTLLADVVIDGGHRLDGAGSWTGEGEFAVGHFAGVQRERPVAEHDKTTVGELAGFVFMEIEHDFFIGEIIF